jgi:hypothetical protein
MQKTYKNQKQPPKKTIKDCQKEVDVFEDYTILEGGELTHITPNGGSELGRCRERPVDVKCSVL